jgi:hypothetical protein
MMRDNNYVMYCKVGSRGWQIYIPSEVKGVCRSDGKYVDPLVYMEGSCESCEPLPYKICPYQDCSVEIQKSVVQELQNWLQSSSITSDWIKATWPGGTDVMYVACIPCIVDAVSDVSFAFAGCIAIDCKNFDPFISHLCVREDLRHAAKAHTTTSCSFSWGKRLLRFGLDACRISLGSSMARLWCSDALVPYYVKQGWWKELLHDDGQEKHGSHERRERREKHDRHGTRETRSHDRHSINVMCKDTGISHVSCDDDAINAILSDIMV